MAPFDADKVLRLIAECPQAPARSGEPQAEVICALAEKQAGEPSQGQEEISEGDLNNLEPRQVHGLLRQSGAKTSRSPHAGMHVSVPLWNMTGPLWNMTGETWPKPWEIDDVYSMPVRGLNEVSRWQPLSRPPTQEPHRLPAPFV